MASNSGPSGWDNIMGASLGAALGLVFDATLSAAVTVGVISTAPVWATAAIVVGAAAIGVAAGYGINHLSQPSPQYNLWQTGEVTNIEQ